MEFETINNRTPVIKFNSQTSEFNNNQNEIEKDEMIRNFKMRNDMFSLNSFVNTLSQNTGKNSFLIFKNHKYFTLPTESIAFFYVKYGTTILKGFDGNEYSVKYSLREVQQKVSAKQFFRLNRKYLVNFSAIKETEHYFARKLLVNLKVPSPEKLLINKENVTMFLQWLEER